MTEGDPLYLYAAGAALTTQASAAGAAHRLVSDPARESKGMAEAFPASAGRLHRSFIIAGAIVSLLHAKKKGKMRKK